MFSRIYGKKELKKDGKIYGVKNNLGNLSIIEFDCFKDGEKFFYFKKNCLPNLWRYLIQLSLVKSPLPLTGSASPRYVGSGLKIHINQSLQRAKTSRASLIDCPPYVFKSDETP